MLNIDRKINIYLIIVTLELRSCIYANHFHMWVYLIVRSKSMVSLLLEVTRVSRPGAAVCLYLRKNRIYKICLKYSNSVCDLLIGKIHSQNLMIILLPSNPTLPTKRRSPISPNCMFSFLFMNIAHIYAKYRQKNKHLSDYCDS